MSNPPSNPQAAASASAQSSQEEQRALQQLLESVRFLHLDVLNLASDWQAGKTYPLLRQQLTEIEEELLVPIKDLERELSRPEGPAPAQVEGLLKALIGAQGKPAPLARLQGIAGTGSAPGHLDEQRLQSKIDTLSIQINVLRAQWQDYLKLRRADAAPGAPPRTAPTLRPSPRTTQRAGEEPSAPRPIPPIEEVGEEEPPFLRPASSPPVPPEPPRRQRPGGWEELGDLLRALLPILLALLVIAFVAFALLSQLPRNGTQPALATTPTLPAATSQPPPTSAPTLPVVSSRPPVTPPGSARLSVNPSVLALPCPATGEALLALTNTGTMALTWSATIVSPSGTDPGILLDGEPGETGRLSPGAVFQMSVTAQARQAQGTIIIQYSGSSGSIRVPYSVNC